MTLTFLKSHDEEFALRIQGLSIPDPNALKLWRSLLYSYSDEDQSSLKRLFKLSSSLPYEHDGLSSELYFPHVLRVASYSGLFSKDSNLFAPTIGLFHNMLEVTNVNLTSNHPVLPATVLDALNLLTVDRSLQQQDSYLEGYYGSLLNSPMEVRTVKVFDKIDNMYLLHLHDNLSEKFAYRHEILKYVVPLASSLSPSLESHLIDLLDFSISHEPS